MTLSEVTGFQRPLFRERIATSSKRDLATYCAAKQSSHGRAFFRLSTIALKIGETNVGAELTELTTNFP